MTACPFCEIVAGRAAAAMVREWPDVVAFVPLNPVVDGHTLAVPRRHVAHTLEDPVVAGATMTRAAELAADLGGDLNFIASVGPDATQTVYHLHIHIVPRAKGDGLPLPWTPQQASTSA